MLAPISDFKAQIPNVRPSPRPPASSTSQPPRFVMTLNAEGVSDALIRVPLAVTGKWVRGKTLFAITRQDLEDIVRNFRDRQNGEINVDYDHASEMPEVAAGGPVPSAGRIVTLDRPEPLNGSRKLEVGNREGPNSLLPASGSRLILYGWYEPTERARELLQSREYRYISPAIDWTAHNKLTGKPQGTTLTSVALTNRPFLEELPQVRLSDPAFQPADEGETRNAKTEHRPAARNSAVSSFQFPVSNSGGSMKHVNLSVVEGQIRLGHDDFKDEYYLEPEDAKRCLHELGMMSEVTPPSATLADASAAVTLVQAGSLLSEAEARGKSVPALEVFHAQVEHELEQALQAGKILPRQRDDWRKIALADFPAFRKILGGQKPLVPVRPVGFTGAGPGDVQAQVKFLAEQRMREQHISFGQALSDIGREQPDLVQQYRRAVSGNE
ncbi:MAG: phage protease [Terriglobia bacterium]